MSLNINKIKLNEIYFNITNILNTMQFVVKFNRNTLI